MAHLVKHPDREDQSPVAAPAVREIVLQSAGSELSGILSVPRIARALVLFAHGSGSSRSSPRNRQVATALNEAGLATLLFDLLTREEERRDELTREYRFDIDLLTVRLVGAIDWVREQRELDGLAIGIFGASTGAAAALRAAAERPEVVGAVVSRGGRPDLAEDALPFVRAPVLLIVGEWDSEVLELNEAASQRLGGPREVKVVPRATHLFEEPGALAQVARFASEWFGRHLTSAP